MRSGSMKPIFDSKSIVLWCAVQRQMRLSSVRVAPGFPLVHGSDLFWQKSSALCPRSVATDKMQE